MAATDPTRTMGRKLRATFVMEQHLGHQSFYENLRRATLRQNIVDSLWVPISYRDSTPLWDRVPGPLFRVRNAVIGRTQVRRGLTARDAEVLFFNTQVPAALGGRSIRHCPYVVCTDMTPRQFDDMSVQYDHSADGSGPVSQLKHRINTQLFRHAAKVVAWSTWVRDSLIDDYGVSPDSIEVIAPGVDLSLWRAGPDRTTSGPLRILFVGGDLDRKGGQDLLAAFAQLEVGTAEVHMVTRSPVPNPAPGVIVHSNLTPNAPELIQLYADSDVFVLPSHAEAFGIAAAEAAASGLPVIATRIGGLIDIVDHGTTGYLIDTGDVDELAALLRTLQAQPELCRRLGAAGRMRAERLFDSDKNAERIAEVLASASTVPTRPLARHQAAERVRRMWAKLRP